jgi:flagellar biosynthesis GTPase FlhF
MIPPQTIAKYNKVWMLAQRGEPNEAKNAQRVLTNMQRQFPEIEREAEKARTKEKEVEKEIHAPNEPEGRHWSEVYADQKAEKEEQKQRKEKWTEWKDKANSFFEWAAHSAHSAFSMHQLQEWTYDVEIRLRENRSGSVSAAVKIPKNIVWKVDRLSDQHRLLFARMVGQMLEQEVFEYLGEGG